MASVKEWTVGELVWVRRSASSAGRLQQIEEEAGTILQVGCAYRPTNQDAADAGLPYKDDGVMVKLQVSNTRGIYPPSWLRALEESPTEEALSLKDSDTDKTPAASAGRRPKRAAVTPSPISATILSDGSHEDRIRDAKRPKLRNNKSGKVKGKPNNAEVCIFIDNENETSSRNRSRGKKLAPTKSTTKAELGAGKKSASKSPNSVVIKPKNPKNSSAENKSRNKVLIVLQENSDSDNGPHRDSDDGEEEDYPFRVEYATSGRSTCRSCDMKIEKEAVRICHRPLFRGKPGFITYRHLHCATFDENVDSIHNIGGWKRLKKADRERLSERVEEAKIIMQKENEELEPDELVQVTFQGETRSAPEGLAANLLPFQVEGTSWMYHQETKVPDIRGGILADEMGMGKTIQTITTILDNRPKLQHCKPGTKHPPSAPDLEDRGREESLWTLAMDSWHHEMKMANVPPKLLPKKSTKNNLGGGARAGTLVVCPVIALYQWKEEIMKFTNGTALTISTYHGPNRAKQFPRELLAKSDIVLTTYQVIEAEFRKMVSPNKVKCPNCGGSFKIDKLRVHLKYFCGESAQRTEAQARQRRTVGRVGRTNRGGNGNRRNQSPAPKTKKSFANSRSLQKKKGAKNDTPKPKLKYQPKKTTTKKRVARVRGSAQYDSDSELSIPDDVAVLSSSTARPSRSAARTATQKMSASAKEWGTTNLKDSESEENEVSSDEESVSSRSDDTEDSSSEDMLLDTLKRTKTNTKRVVKNKAVPSSSDASESSSEDEDESLSSSDDDDAIQEAREKQRMALERANKNKSRGRRFGLEKKKPLGIESGKSKDKKKTGKMGQASRKKKQRAGGKSKKGKSKEELSSDDNDSDSRDHHEDRDPMDGIDMDELVQEAMAGCRVSVLHTFCWWRIVLDEAHMIKSRSSQTAAAAFALTAIHRWCLSGAPINGQHAKRFFMMSKRCHWMLLWQTAVSVCVALVVSNYVFFFKCQTNLKGTPLQNRCGELYSLIRFLRIDPMAHYFCRKEGCNCKSVHYRMMQGKCQDCGHGSIQHYSHFNKHVLNPIQRGGYQGDGRRAMMKLKNEVLDKSLLRRTKQSRAEDMCLPPRCVQIRAIRLHPVELDFYNGLYTQTKSSFDDYVQEGTLLNNYAHIFDLLTKLRQSVDHPYLIVFSKKKQLSNQGIQAVANGSVECDLCNEPPTDRVVSSCCGAAFCRSCVLDYMSPALENADRDVTRCPACRAPFSIDLQQASSDVVDDGTLTVAAGNGSQGNSREGMPSLKEMSHVASGSILRRINLAEFATSTKIEALVQELVCMRQQRQGSKALVFSQFVNMLDLIRWRIHADPCLQDLGLGVRIIHGGMNVQSRDAALKDFREDPSVRCLLMSLKAGGVALNLTVANEAYLMDPWWNPAAEMQAIDRTHRLGQYRPIRAVRFIAEGTVEERVLQLQEKKRLVFDGTVGRDAASLKMLTVDDMKAMFT